VHVGGGGGCLRAYVASFFSILSRQGTQAGTRCVARRKFTCAAQREFTHAWHRPIESHWVRWPGTRGRQGRARGQHPGKQAERRKYTTDGATEGAVERVCDAREWVVHVRAVHVMWLGTRSGSQPRLADSGCMSMWVDRCCVHGVGGWGCGNAQPTKRAA